MTGSWKLVLVLLALAASGLLVNTSYAVASEPTADSSTQTIAEESTTELTDNYLQYSNIVRGTLAWANGVEDTSKQDQTYSDIYYAALRYDILFEFALAVVATEAHFEPDFSWARKDSWDFYQTTTGHSLATIPQVTADVNTALSELRQIMATSDSLNEVLSKYWCGPEGPFNSGTRDQFIEAASEQWSKLRPYVETRLAYEDWLRYDPLNYSTKKLREQQWPDETDEHLLWRIFFFACSGKELVQTEELLTDLGFENAEQGTAVITDEGYTHKVWQTDFALGDQTYEVNIRITMTGSKWLDCEVRINGESFEE